MPCFEKQGNIWEKRCEDKCGSMDAIVNETESKLNSTALSEFEGIEQLMDSMAPLCK